MIHLTNTYGFVECRTIDRSGNTVQEIREKNLLLASLGNVLAWLFADPRNHSDLAITKIGFGINSAVPVISNTSLSTSKVVKDIAGHTLDGSKVTYAWELDYAEGNDLGGNIAEAGLFTTSGILVARKVYSPSLVKTSEFKLSGTWTIHLGVSASQGIGGTDVVEYYSEYEDPTDSPENTVYPQ